ncbi:uncharacterized protein LOC133334891 isoform X1 [Musca vetustissima]|uniref:uncharacterized protein LOC133334891 isoform X1 n=1 Tax=Musca vetustissima TaxID=27455 RepID=UPI002AB6FB08|nr:uncharacterized protein LOC133334891 isoform X1 [Musca vetustissima]
MRAFIVLCLVAVACADKLGYNYQPVEHSSSGLSFTPGTGVGTATNVAPTYTGGVGTYGGQQRYVAPTSTGGVSSYEGQGSVGTPTFVPQAELEKEFYTYTANDADFNEPASSDQYANSLKKGLRVIFIKGPENSGLEDAAVALAKNAAQQETAIYVLNKQADLSSLANKLNTINTGNNNKPEVHFVKYRTPEDAANAQRAIQGQYDSLGGPSHSINGGVAPVINFASQVPVAPVPAPSTPGASYLPASIFRQ